MNAHILRLTRWFAAAAVCAALAACGGSDVADSTTPPPPPPPSGNTAPVASFAGATAVAAGVPLPLDASASLDADGDPLTYSWSLSDGQRGGGQKIAMVFDVAGDFTVRLTVDDGRGGVHSVDRTVTVSPGPAAVGAVDTLVVVRDTTGALVPGATVSVNRTGGASTSTGADGRASLSTDRGIPVTLKVSKPGYADQFRTQTLPAAAESGYLQVTLLAREPALTLASAADGGELVGKDGVKVSFAPDSLVDADGNPVSGPVQVFMTPVDVVDNVRAFPGRFAGVRPDGAQGLLLSYGTVEFVLSADGAPVQLAAGKKATIEIPVYTGFKRDGTPIVAGDTFPIWSLNERTGAWIEEGVGTAVAAASPSEFALRAEVTHFSWWNHDDFDGDPARPKPKCQVDTNLDGIPEDLSGTGYCWHEAVPELEDFELTITERMRPSATPAPKRALAEPRTRRIPTFAATAATPVGGGVELPIPADLNVVFRSWAMNGTLFGSKVVRAGAGVSEDVGIVLAPVKDATGLNRIELPYDDNFVVQTLGEVDQFVFTPADDVSYQVRVTRAVGTTLAGEARITQGSGTPLASATFGASPFERIVRAAGTEDITVAVAAGPGSPGAYRIEVVALPASSCTGAEALTLPMSPRNLRVPPNGRLCFTVDLAADDALLIQGDTRGLGSFTSTFNTTGGESLASKTYALSQFSGSFAMRAAVVQPGTYGVELVNRAGTADTVVQSFALSKIPLDGTLDVPDQRSIVRAAGDGRSFWYVAKPAVAGTAIALTLNDLTSEHGIKVWPSEAFANKTASGRPVGRVVRVPPALHPLIQVQPTNSTRVGDITVTTGTPLDLAADTDVPTTVPATGTVAVYGFDAAVGEELTLAASTSREPNFFAPTFAAALASAGPGVGSFPGIFTVGETGKHTVELNAGVGTAGSAYTFRLNRLPPPEAITLGSRFERTDTLALGEIKRYSFAATQGQLLGFELTSPTALEAALRVVGGDIYLRSTFAELSGTAPRALSTGPRYVQTSGTATVQVYSQTVGTLANRSGAFGVAVSAPTPTPVQLGAAVSTTLQANAFAAYAYDITTPGRHLLCYRHAGEIRRPGFERHVETVVWGPSATTPNYEGDIQPDNTNSTEFIDDLRVGSNTLSLFTRLASIDVTARLLRLPDPVDIAVGAAADAGNLAPCELRYHRFAAAADQAFTLTVDAGFAGRVQLRKLDANGVAGTVIVGTAQPLVSGTPRVVSFTIPTSAAFGTGTYAIEVDGDGDAAGPYTVSLTSP